MFQLPVWINGEDSEYWNVDCLVRIHILNNQKIRTVCLKKAYMDSLYV